MVPLTSRLRCSSSPYIGQGSSEAITRVRFRPGAAVLTNSVDAEPRTLCVWRCFQAQPAARPAATRIRRTMIRKTPRLLRQKLEPRIGRG